MTLLILAFVIVQAALLLWASVRLSDVLLRPDKAAQFALYLATMAVPLWIAWWGRTNDPTRLVCGIGDCLALTLSVAFIRFWAVSKEEEAWRWERELARQSSLARAEAARKAQDEERILAAAKVLEMRSASELQPTPSRGTPRAPGSRANPPTNS